MIGQAMQSEDPSVRRQAIMKCIVTIVTSGRTQKAKEPLQKNAQWLKRWYGCRGITLKQKFNKSGGVNVTVQNAWRSSLYNFQMDRMG